MKIFSFQCQIGLLLLTLAFILYPTGFCVDVDVYTQFRVELSSGPVTRQGNSGGSCHGIDADLNAIYREAIDMAQVALDSINNYVEDSTVRATLETFFGIKEDEFTTLVDTRYLLLFNFVEGTVHHFSKMI